MRRAWAWLTGTSEAFEVAASTVGWRLVFERRYAARQALAFKVAIGIDPDAIRRGSEALARTLEAFQRQTAIAVLDFARAAKVVAEAAHRAGLEAKDGTGGQA